MMRPMSKADKAQRNREEYELERVEYEWDSRPCALCEHHIGLRSPVTRAGFIYHEACADSMCHFCGQFIRCDEKVADPNDFGFKDMGERAHEECAEEAKREAESIRLSDELTYKHATGRLGEDT